MAAQGIQNVAELGSKSAFTKEVNTAISSGTAAGVLSTGGISGTQTEVSLTATLTPTHPLLTLVSMVAPSPDWFVGVTSQVLYQNGVWVDKLTVPLEVYDTGTDSGVSFASADLATRPAGWVLPLTSAVGDTDFSDGVHRQSRAYMAVMVFERLG